MAERDQANAQLARILAFLPAVAAQPGGILLSELARMLKISESRLRKDIEAIIEMAYYHHAGAGDALQISLDADRVAVFTTAEFARPTRLTPRESLALGIGMRIIAAETAAAMQPVLIALAERLEQGVLGAVREDPDALIAVNTGAEEVRAELTTAAQKQQCCTIGYVKNNSEGADERTVDPYALVVAEGTWYLIGFCHRNQDIRVFRTDRVLDVEVLEQSFVKPEDFDATQYVSNGRVFVAAGHMEVPVRYSAAVARWIVENNPVEEQEDGSVIIRHEVADPVWLVGHVLEYGADAEVLGPPEMRARVAAAAARVRGARDE